jgi:hypothetical protein
MKFARNDVQAMWEGFRDEACDGLGIPRMWSGEPRNPSMSVEVRARKLASAHKRADEMMRKAVARKQITAEEWRIYRSNLPDGLCDRATVKMVGARRPDNKRPAAGQKRRSMNRQSA